MKRILILTLMATIFFACEPTSKEKYMADYKRFVDEVAAQGSNYTADDWKKANETFSKFNNEWYKKFESEFTLNDKARILGYQVKYNAVKAGSEIGKFYNQYLKNDVEDLRAKVKFYVENDMESDLKKLQEEAKKVSKELEEEIKKIIKEMEKK
ncbi:MAG TPA: hypothetical protein PL017_03450 [Tenuifilaceae bacterium]|nr:hypothetical protein [Tenuifilaceae bacterium]HPE17501.1 hypothetical protein [Tenuifilaceae bacterium]HPJ45128.1 hypothetical protein [Tenuifilaceae bacterium]HPQ33728.1 hypothetical protein [Tenuifilaceae bacterium]HRX68051.1 hypothetical protein [Tenuifilaceae bacterium]